MAMHGEVAPDSPHRSGRLGYFARQNLLCGWRSRNERIAKQRARMKRHDEARVNRFATAEEPDAGMLYALRERIIPTTGQLGQLCVSLTWQQQFRSERSRESSRTCEPTQAEIVAIPLRHKFRRCGAMPQRHGPRLVIGVLNEFVNRLSEFPIADEDQKRLRKIAMRARAGIASRFSRSRSST